MRWIAFLASLLFVMLLPRAASCSPQATSSQQMAPQSSALPNTSDGLQDLLGQILDAAQAKDRAKEENLIHGLLIPENSTWFTDEYGPGFGGSLAAAYERLRPSLEEQIKSVYEGNVQRGWMHPLILRYADPEAANSPIDKYLNCMDKIVPLYATAFNGQSTGFYFSLKPGENSKRAGGDLDGYFVYDQGSFRFVPTSVLIVLPSQRPILIHLGLDVMSSKIIKRVPVTIPPSLMRSAIQNRTSMLAAVEVVLDLNGNIKESKISEGDPALGAALLDSVKQWRFAPTKLDGDPVEVDFEIPYQIVIGH